ncbi:MAG: hypothetical protein ABSG80_12815 [Verrucomicrobiota bacterium]|jgi:hypothetical protein
MKSEAPFTRPSLPEALDAWKKVLAERGFATDIIWIFAENLCVEKSRAEPGGFHFGFQTRFTPPPEDALDIAFAHFSESNKPVVFYRLGGRPGRSVCALLCDSWFERRSNADGFLRRDEWRVLFYPGQKDEIEEVTDLTRWLRRVKRDRAFHDLDFCMALEAIDEIRMYGRVLMPYERLAAAMLGRLRRVLGQPA